LDFGLDYNTGLLSYEINVQEMAQQLQESDDDFEASRFYANEVCDHLIYIYLQNVCISH